MTDIGDVWVPKRGKAGKEFVIRHLTRSPLEVTCVPLRVKQIYRPDKAVLVVDEQGTSRIVKVADLKKHWKLEQ